MGFDPISIFITLASMAYQQSQASKMKRRQEAEADKRKGQQFSTRGEVRSIPVVYGKQKVGENTVGHRVSSNFSGAINNSDKVLSTNLDGSGSGSKNEFLITQGVICHEGIESVESIDVNDIDYKGTGNELKEDAVKYMHRFNIHYEGGTACNVATANSYPNTNKFTNCAFSTNIFKLDRDKPQYSGLPRISYYVKGRKVRKVINTNGVYTLDTNYVYSNNPSWCLLDYLLNPNFGRGLPVSSVHLESFYKAAAICDIIVKSNAWGAGSINGAKPIFSYDSLTAFPPTGEANYHYYAEDTNNLYEWKSTGVVDDVETGSFSQIPSPTTSDLRLYECNITLDTDSLIRENIERILDTMGMSELVWTPKGQYKLILDYPLTDQEQSDLVVATFDEDSIIRDAFNISFPRAEERFTQVTASFLNEYEDFKEDKISWPPSNSTVYAEYLAKDNNKPSKTELKVEGITTPYQAQAFAEQQVRKSRTMYNVSFTASKAALIIEPGDLIKINLPLMDINNVIFRVSSTEINSDFTVKIQAYLFDYSILAWNIDDNIPYVVKPQPSFTVPKPYNVTFNTTAEVLGTASGKVTWDINDDIVVRGYIVELSTDGVTWQELGRTSVNSFDVTGLKTGVYTFAVKAYTITGATSDRVTSGLGTTVQLKTVSKVLVVYADSADEATNTQSLTVGSNQYVAYYEFDSDAPTLPIRSGISFTKFVGYTPVKGVDYDDGADATSVAQLQVYKRSATAITTAPTGGSFNFGTATTTAPPTWSTEIPSGTDPVYVSVGVASVVGTTGIDSSITWSDPEIAFSVGADGATGKSNFLASVYKRSTTALTTAPTGGSFNFESNVLTPPVGWSSTIPQGSDTLYGSQYLFSIFGDEGTDTAGTWSTPAELARVGEDGYTPVKGVDYFDGTPGDDGVSTYQITVYRRSSTTITTAPTGGAYNFTNQALTTPSGWYAAIPAGTDPVYATTALASISGVTGSDTSLNWTVPTKVMENGAAGATGATGAAGTNGARGAGWWRYETGLSSATTGLSNTTLNAYMATATGLTPTAGDRLIVVNTAGVATGYVRNNANTSWAQQAAFIDGNLLVADTVTASAINVSRLGDIAPNAGTITAGVLKNNSGSFVIDLTNGTITISV